MSEPMYIDRPPRIQPELPYDEIEIPGPPDKDQGGFERLIQVGLPLLTIIGYVLISTMGGSGRSPLLLIPMALSVFASVGFSIYTFIREKQRQAEIERAYSARLTGMTREMNQQHDQQRRFYHYNYPETTALMRIVDNAGKEAQRTQQILASNAQDWQRAVSQRAEARLWERRASDSDFGVIRLGIGTLPSTVLYKLGQSENVDDPQMREAQKLEDESRFVTEIPVILSLRPKPDELGDDEEENPGEEEEGSSTPALHALAIAGGSTEVYEFAHAILAHFMVFHAPMDAKIYLLAGSRTPWQWLEEAPHSRVSDDGECICFVDPLQQNGATQRFGDDDGSPVEQFLEQIRKILAQRKLRLQENEGTEDGGNPTQPTLLVVVDLLDAIFTGDSPLQKLEEDAAISILLEEGTLLGAAVIFLVPERSKAPSRCQGVIEIERTTPATNRKLDDLQKLHFRYAETGVNSFRYVGVADAIAHPLPDAKTMMALVQKMAQLEVRQGAGANVTSTVLFMDLMGYHSLQDLVDKGGANWQFSANPEYANYLRVKLGRMSGNKARDIVFSAKRDGVHGMIAGSTGSGKSELLISLIIGLAVTYDPSMINFVLVDYKGGGAFKEFVDLPHCVDIITNLNSEGVTRMFTAINAEIDRRQERNADRNVKDIVDYHKKGYHLPTPDANGRPGEPYPFLFIIIDEFAEMIADRAEYKTELERITRVGRSVGVILILAAQRPSGVTDQMRSNIKLRICLRVESTGESREMLRRGDAAFLPSIPGRGYLQVGNEEIELIQTAYTGETYIDPDANTDPTELVPVRWPDRHQSTEQDDDQEPKALYAVIIDQLKKLAHQQDVKEQHAPWPNFLPQPPAEVLSLSTPLISSDPTRQTVTSAAYLVKLDAILLGREQPETLPLNPYVKQWLDRETKTASWIEQPDWQNHALRPVVGLVDNPYAAQQLPLVINFPRGHVAVFGASGWGKTTLLRTLIVSLAATHSPSHAHLYLLDLGGRNLGVFSDLPHVGAVITPDSDGYRERVEQLFREIDQRIEERKPLLEAAGANDIYQYNAAHPEQPLPPLVLVIDNFVEFRETFDNNDDNIESVVDKFELLARQGRSYGIHIIITATQLGTVPNHLYNLFTERLTFKLADHTEYRAIVGGYVGEISDIVGRGYIKMAGQPLSFQLALPIGQSEIHAESSTEVGEATNETRELERFAEAQQVYVAAMRRNGSTFTLPFRVDPLAKAILFKQMLAHERTAEPLPLDASFLSALKTRTHEAWQTSTQVAAADWLKVAIGVGPGNHPRLLELEAKKDGVHGLIAGGTGSGKSELLMTLIVGLALCYDPSILNFVLVDYKGGGAFKPFETLPHCVDIVTNLNTAAVKRMFTAINAEMQRRQALNAETNTKDIVDYRAKGYHLQGKDGGPGIPYPHLFIIIDEYAEMIGDNPEFRDELESITRVGRAQGVNLLLASQRPTGVTDQMRANIKFRICLRVEGVDTSREMLRRDDAAFLPNGMPGRGYLQVGNENIELMQVAWTGDTYDYVEAPEGEEQPKFFDVVVNLSNELLAEQPNSERPRTPWPPFLPKAMTFARPLVERYLDKEYRHFLTVGQAHPATATTLTLNPALQQWFDGEGRWAGIDWNRHVMRAVAGLLDDPYRARQLPLLLNLTTGHGVIFGASGWGKTALLRAMIVSLAATHSPDELHVHILDLGGRNLTALAALPHVGTVILPDERGYEEQVQQLLRELNDIVDRRKLLFAQTGVSSLLEYNSPDDESERGEPRNPEPAILVVLDNFGEYVETFGDAAGGSDEDNLLTAFVALTRQGKAYGVHVVITATRLNVLSSKLYSLFTERLTMRLSDTTEYSGVVGSGAIEVEEIAGRGLMRIDRRPLNFQVALVPGAIDETKENPGPPRGETNRIRLLGEAMRQHMATVTGETGHRYNEPLKIGALPKASSYRQVLTDLHHLRHDESMVAELKAATEKVWAESSSAAGADWLKVVLGIVSGNRPRLLELEAKKDGVHGLIAGGTGSGKSELLMTLIVGLALNYSPDILNFVLVDYKGGGAFKPFEQLPHCVDIVTNLNSAAVARMFTAINAEIRRRQELNAQTGTKDIVEYREKGLHLPVEQGGLGIAYPHLFVIIDEYAEMIDENPDYRAELESITRVGRAQGINLLLASQRPKGVSDQMRANIKFRICLRVEEMDTSREMLRRPDAALLPNGMPGRGYLQVGNDNIELIQVSWTGETQVDDRPPAALWPERPQGDAVDATDDLPKFFDAVVDLTAEIYREATTNDPHPTPDASTPAQRMGAPKPWPGFLPTQFSLQSRLVDAKTNRTFILEPVVTNWLNGETTGLWPGVDWNATAMRPVVGLLDDPAEARQDPLQFDLSRNHLVVMGDNGMGKTSLLRTLITALAVTHSPNELHVYILDLGGRNFGNLEALPHVGAAIYAADESYEERLNRLLDKLNRVVETRQQLLGAQSLYEYNQENQARPLPALLVAIDNFAELQENAEALVENTLLPLVRRSLSVGISFVVTCNVPNNMPSKLYGLFGQRITFKQSNADRYMDIVGRGAIEIDDVPGRGYIRVERRPLLFHTAQPVGFFDEESGLDTRGEGAELQLLAAQMNTYLAQEPNRWQSKPDPIAILPETVSLAEMFTAAQTSATGNRSQRFQAILGMSANLQPAFFDLKRLGPHFAVIGPPLAGKTTTLYNFIISLALRYSPQQLAFVLIDMQGRLADYGGTQRLDSFPHVLTSITEVEPFKACLEEIKTECEALATGQTTRELFVIIDSFDDFNEEIERERDLQRDLATLARRYGRDGLHFVIAGTLDSSGSSELRRRVLSSNYGIGLRTAETLTPLRVARTPAALQGKELPLGRGYWVKAGQPTMIQVATPFTQSSSPFTSDEDTEKNEELLIRALDKWITQIQQQYPEPRAAWSSGTVDGATTADSTPQQSAEVQRMLAALQGFMRKEMAELKGANGTNGTDTLITTGLLALDLQRWHNEAALKELVKRAFVKAQYAGMPEETAIGLVDSMEMGTDDFLHGIEQMLADAEEPE